MTEKFKVTPDLYTSKGNRFVHYIVDIIVILLVFYGIFLGFIFLYYSIVEDTSGMDNFLDNNKLNSDLSSGRLKFDKSLMVIRQFV